MDDLKISYKDPVVVTDIILRLNDKYRQLKPMISTHEKIHEYLGVTIDLKDTSKVKITMYGYVDEMISKLPIKMIRESATAASNYLFDICGNDDADQLLTPEFSEKLHHLVAKTAVAFLTTGMKPPNNDDQKKLSQLMKYKQKETKYLPLILEDDDTGVLKWYIDESFAIHNAMISHTGINLTLGKGTIYGGSFKQKRNSKSSMEAELISTSNRINQVL